MELIKAFVAICGLFNMIKHTNQTIITSNIWVTDPKWPFNKKYFNCKGPFNVISSARSLVASKDSSYRSTLQYV